MSKIFTPEEAVATLRHCANEQHCMECAMYPHLRSGECTMKLCAAAADTIEALIEENKRIREELRWIPVAERLPELDSEDFIHETVPVVEVLVMIEGATKSATLCFNGDTFFDLKEDGEFIPYRVTHWKPMPNGPEAE